MKITKSKLKQIIKEELESAMSEGAVGFGLAVKGAASSARAAAAGEPLFPLFDIAKMLYEWAAEIYPQIIPKLAAAGGALAAVEILDSIAGRQLRKLIAKATGASQEEINNIPKDDFISMIARAVSENPPPAGIVAQSRGDKSYRFGDQDVPPSYAPEFARKLDDEKAAKRIAGRGARTPSYDEMIKYKLPKGTVMAPVNENKITKSQLKQIIKEELDLTRLAGSAIDDYHLLLLETAELYKELATMRPEEEFLYDRIKKLHASFSRMHRRAKIKQKYNK